MWSLTTPVMTLRSAHDPQMVKATNSGLVHWSRSNNGRTLCHSCPFMKANSVNMESSIVANISWVSFGIASGSSRIWPQPIILVVRIAKEYRQTNVSTSTQNMLCIARTTPMASWRSGRIALTTRTSRRMRIKRSIRANIIICPKLLRWFSPSMRLSQIFSNHWSKTPHRTMKKSIKFQYRSSGSVKNLQCFMRNLKLSSSTKNTNMICSTQNHMGDFKSVSKPMMTELSTMTTPTNV
mmetsp:Transcript_175383/g.562629  ORF Transcript_175383/g.562629 Transcript_175383/m.562629 type:complete len:238 (-) Transcript_175383:843-1556(-)